MNTLTLSLLVALQLPFLLLSAQQRTEGGIFLGAAHYQGDLAPSPVAASETRLAVGGLYRYMFTDKFGVRGTVTWAKLSGKDRNRAGFIAEERNWNMSANLIELAVHPEWHFFGADRYGNTGLHARLYSPFLSIGLGAAFANIKLDVPLEDRFKAPEPDAGNTFLVVPITAGIRFDITEDFVVSAEFGTRYTFSDYIDGISLNGNPDKKDWYFFAGISAVYIIEEIVGSKGNRW